jgi:hypothetical protein
VLKCYRAEAAQLLSGLLASIKNTVTDPSALKAFKTTQKADRNAVTPDLNLQRCFKN